MLGPAIRIHYEVTNYQWKLIGKWYFDFSMFGYKKRRTQSSLLILVFFLLNYIISSSHKFVYKLKIKYIDFNQFS